MSQALSLDLRGLFAPIFLNVTVFLMTWKEKPKVILSKSMSKHPAEAGGRRSREHFLLSKKSRSCTDGSVPNKLIENLLSRANTL